MSISVGQLLSEPTFWLVVGIMASLIVVWYFVTRNAIADGLMDFEERKHRQNGDSKGRRL